MGGCQNVGPFLDPYYNTAPYIWGTQKGTIILTTTHIAAWTLWARSLSLTFMPIGSRLRDAAVQSYHRSGPLGYECRGLNYCLVRVQGFEVSDSGLGIRVLGVGFKGYSGFSIRQMGLFREGGVGS